MERTPERDPEDESDEKRPARGEAGEGEATDESPPPENEDDERSWESFPASDAPSY